MVHPGAEGGPAPGAAGAQCGELAAESARAVLCCAPWQEYKAVFYECSAMTGYNIMEPMLHMARSVTGAAPWYFPSCRSLVRALLGNGQGEALSD